jgi:hypothetical protein
VPDMEEMRKVARDIAACARAAERAIREVEELVSRGDDHDAAMTAVAVETDDIGSMAEAIEDDDGPISQRVFGQAAGHLGRYPAQRAIEDAARLHLRSYWVGCPHDPQRCHLEQAGAER